MFIKLTFYRFIVLAAMLAAIQYSGAQSATPAPSGAAAGLPETKGLTETESIEGTLNSGDNALKLDSAVGWDFNKHFGVSVGVPLYFVHVSSSTTTGAVPTTTPSYSNNGIGDVYLGLALRLPNPILDYSSTLTGAGPTGNTKKGLSTGRATVDWDNRIEHSFGNLSPFLDGGLGNTVRDTRLYVRPFTSLGFVAHLEEGAEYGLHRHFSVGGSFFEIVPVGNQKVFSKLVKAGQAVAAGKGKNNRVFETAAVTSGSGLTRENGVNTWIGFEPTPVWRLELGYTRSMTYALDSFTFNVSMNVAKLLRSKSN
ncbi:MAG TPA: hypothetical protein VN176_17770 [Verrucomicrobiae bacterium]|nr:hypothetical protein [Verrucomicrobiae bacterium]